MGGKSSILALRKSRCDLSIAVVFEGASGLAHLAVCLRRSNLPPFPNALCGEAIWKHHFGLGSLELCMNCL